MKYLFTVTLPIEADDADRAKELAWERLADHDEPADGMTETLTEQPE